MCTFCWATFYELKKCTSEQKVDFKIKEFPFCQQFFCELKTKTINKLETQFWKKTSKVHSNNNKNKQVRVEFELTEMEFV